MSDFDPSRTTTYIKFIRNIKDFRTCKFYEKSSDSGPSESASRAILIFALQFPPESKYCFFTSLNIGHLFTTSYAGNPTTGNQLDRQPSARNQLYRQPGHTQPVIQAAQAQATSYTRRPSAGSQLYRQCFPFWSQSRRV